MNSQLKNLCELSWGEHDLDKKQVNQSGRLKSGSFEFPHQIKHLDLYHDAPEDYRDKIKAHNATLGKPVLDSVRHYTSATGSKNINRHLRQGEPISPEQQEHLENLKQATQHVLPHNLVLYRGSHIHPKDLPVGTTFSDPGFTSTSREPNTPKYFSNVYSPDSGRKTIFQIKSDKPLKGHDVNGNSKYAENEVILHPNTKFTVTGHSQNGIEHVVHLHAHQDD